MFRNFYVYLSIIIGLHLLVKDVFNLEHSSETNNLKLTSTIDKLWNEFWEDYELFDDGFTSKDWISNRETFIIILLSSFLQSKVSIPTHLLNLKVFYNFLTNFKLLPPSIKFEHIQKVLQIYNANFSKMLLNPETRFEDGLIFIKPKFKTFFTDLLPKKDISHRYGKVIDRFMRAYVTFNNSNFEPTNQELYNRKADFLVTIIPRYWKVVKFLQKRKGGIFWNLEQIFEFGIDGSRLKLPYHRKSHKELEQTFANILLSKFDISQWSFPLKTVNPRARSKLRLKNISFWFIGSILCIFILVLIIIITILWSIDFYQKSAIVIA